MVDSVFNLKWRIKAKGREVGNKGEGNHDDFMTSNV